MAAKIIYFKKSEFHREIVDVEFYIQKNFTIKMAITTVNYLKNDNENDAEIIPQEISLQYLHLLQLS